MVLEGIPEITRPMDRVRNKDRQGDTNRIARTFTANEDNR